MSLLMQSVTVFLTFSSVPVTPDTTVGIDGLEVRTCGPNTVVCIFGSDMTCASDFVERCS